MCLELYDMFNACTFFLFLCEEVLHIMLLIDLHF